MATPYAIDIENLTYGYGAAPVLHDVTLQLEPGARCLLVGGNGTGMHKHIHHFSTYILVQESLPF